MNVCRTRFKKEIITEFVSPSRKSSSKVIIFCAGAPSTPNKDELLTFFAKKNYWTFSPRYRGSWESDGSFLEKSPTQDILDVISSIYKPFIDYWENKEYRLTPKEIIIIGSSFGGSATLLASTDKRIKKVICLAPVVNWKTENKINPLDNLYNLIKKAYGSAYRIKKKDWNKLASGKFYNPEHIISQLQGEKILIFHAHDDPIVSIKPTLQFVKKINAQIITFKKGGHLSSSILMKPSNYKIIKKFLK